MTAMDFGKFSAISISNVSLTLFSPLYFHYTWVCLSGFLKVLDILLNIFFFISLLASQFGKFPFPSSRPRILSSASSMLFLEAKESKAQGISDTAFLLFLTQL